MREEDLIKLKKRLHQIKGMGMIKNSRPGNAGGVGNTLEDLLDVEENNNPMPDFGEWELKTQRDYTGSLLTLFHCEPQPRRARIVPQILLPSYGWAHQYAGVYYPDDERSFRQTINATNFTDRGFIIKIDEKNEVIFVSFDFNKIDDRHDQWRKFIKNGVGINDISPNPYWTFRDISTKLNGKLKNLMYVIAETTLIGDEEYFRYKEIEAYIDPTLDNFLKLLREGKILIDFDARSRHNHGTKFRIKSNARHELYTHKITV